MPEAGKRILVVPLDWGLGHATRCVPLIRELLQKGCEVMLASSGNSAAFLQAEFPLLTHFTLPEYNPVYPIGNGMVAKMGAQLPKFITAIRQEHTEVNKIVREQKIDVLISDNRYGCYSSHAKSIFITHQLNVLMPAGWKWMEGMVNHFNHQQIARFDECWIPANDSQLIPQLLQNTSGVKTRYIGYLSRLEIQPREKKYDILAIASGPSPQREIFAETIFEQLKGLNKIALLVTGHAHGNVTVKTEGNVTVVDFMGTQEINEAICESRLIVCRSGYSSVMDLMKLDKKALLIPTPGQTEQAYIAQVLKETGVAYSAPQQKFDLQKALKEEPGYTGFKNFEVNNTLLKKAIDSTI